jgi:hypothetical protein
MGQRYLTTTHVSIIDCVHKSPIVLQPGTALTLKLIEGDCLFFDGFSAVNKDVLASLTPLDGDNFTYTPRDRVWRDASSIEIPGLRQDLQPAHLNEKFQRLWKRILACREPSWGLVRGVPKHRDIAKARPLGDQSRNPLSISCRWLSRFLDLCLSSPPLKLHFDRCTHAAVTESLHEIRNDPFSDGRSLRSLSNYSMFGISRDVDNGFMRIQHSEALEAWNFLMPFLESSGRTEAWVTPCGVSFDDLRPGSRCKPKPASWSKNKKPHWVHFQLADVRPCLALFSISCSSGLVTPEAGKRWGS